ncbi:MAG: hypothetical protein Phog2KO_04260 [Phototrophicaceae bacterium]
MADNRLPPRHEDETSENPKSGLDNTRPNTPLRQEETEQNAKHKTKLLQKSEATRLNRGTQGNGQHVQPMQGQAPRAYPPRPRRPRRKDPKNNALYLPWWSIALMLLGVIIVSLGFVGGVVLLGNSGGFLAEPSPIILIVTAEQSVLNTNNGQGVQQAPSTEIISGQNAPTNLELSGPTLAPIQLSSTPAPVRVGSVVIVEGVDFDTLNVRSSASLTESSVLFRAQEGESFNVVDGPQQSSGFTWWRIQDPNDVNRVGWAVSNFLTIQTP